MSTESKKTWEERMAEKAAERAEVERKERERRDDEWFRREYGDDPGPIA